MPALNRRVMSALVHYARISPANARLADANPEQFVEEALVGAPLDVTTGVSQSSLAGALAAIPWGSLWLQPTREP